MRYFTAILCCCLVAFASADKLGYNYQPVGHSNSGLSFLPGTAASQDSPSYAVDSGLGSPAGLAGDFSGQRAIQNPNFQSTFQPSGQVAEQTVNAPNYASAQPELQKEFFTYTADEEQFNDPAASEKVSESLNKALRVVFIKGPAHSGLEQAALALAKHAAEQETAIYVLNKQADIGDLANKLNNIQSNNNKKPEVHFVKYRTPEDAANAQRAIQGEYDKLAGASSYQEGGVAPVLNFASSAPVAAAVPAASQLAPASVPAISRPVALEYAPVAEEPEATAPISSYIPPVTPGSTYLPANILRLLRV